MSNQISIIGAGFAALAAAKHLRKLAPGTTLQINLIAPKPEFIYFPSLIWMASGKRTARDITVDLTRFLKRNQINYIPAKVTNLQDAGRTIVTDQGLVQNDGVLIACGGRFIKKLPGIEHVITPCEGIKAAEALRDRLAAMDGGTLAFGFSGNPKEPAAMRGGPIFEFLFGVDQLLRQQNRRDRFKLIFFSPAPKPGIRLGEMAVEKLLSRMKSQGIEIHIGEKLTGFSSNSFSTATKEIKADLTVFMPGMTGNIWFQNSALPLSDGGMIRADATCQVLSDQYQNTYVAGDAGSFPGPLWMPKQAHMAELQAKCAANNLMAELSGQTPKDTFETELICLIDSENKGALVYRKGEKSLMLPPLRLGHWAKRIFEQIHLRQYR